jgi:hypothetical protein
MQQLLPPILDFATSNGRDGLGFVSGKLLGFTADGAPLVVCPACGNDPIPARTLVTLSENEARDAIGSAVLLAFEDSDPNRPIVVGLIRDCLIGRPDNSNSPSREVLVDGKRVVIHADQELLLRCGESSLSLDKAGRIVLRGANVVSRAAQTNKIKGASVHIN